MSKTDEKYDLLFAAEKRHGSYYTISDIFDVVWNRSEEAKVDPRAVIAKGQGLRGESTRRVRDVRAAIVVELRDAQVPLKAIGDVLGGRRKESVWAIERRGRAAA